MKTMKQSFCAIIVLIFLMATAATAQTNLPVSNPTNSPPQTNAPPQGNSGDITDPSLPPLIAGDNPVPISFVVPVQIPAVQIQTTTLSVPPAFSLPTHLGTVTPPAATSPPANRKPSPATSSPSTSQ